MEDKKVNLGYSFVTTGYRDYIASRYLLNNDFFMAGVTLASSALEKYLKGILIIHHLKRKVHLDNLKEIKKALDRVNINIFEELDETFLNILSDAYKLRYYDNLKNALSFGFFANQLLAELDFTINLIDSRLRITNDQTGEIVLTPYRKAVNNNDVKIYLNNYLLNNISKKEFMERSSKVYALHIEKSGLEHEFLLNGLRIQKYEGTIARVTEMKYLGKKQVET